MNEDQRLFGDWVLVKRRRAVVVAMFAEAADAQEYAAALQENADREWNKTIKQKYDAAEDALYRALRYGSL